MELSKQLTGVSKARTLSRPEQTMINDSVSISTVLTYGDGPFRPVVCYQVLSFLVAHRRSSS